MDPIANMLQALRSAQVVNKPAVLPLSKIKLKILEILKQEGYVAKFEVLRAAPPTISVELAQKPIDQIIKLSKPGRRLYTKAKKLTVTPGRLVVLSTPAGIMTSQAARKKNVGGELLFEVRQ